jgi:mono/diheme cytochrome c family protein
MAAGLALLATAGLAGCRQDMHDQPKFVPQRGTSFYADGRSARPQVENTVARGQLHEDSYYVYCTPCHSRVGNGAGMIVQRGYAQAGNFHTARLLAAPLGHFFNVMTNGYGAMPDYAAQLTPADRWAVVAYIKALQLSQSASQADVASGEQVAPLSSIAEKEGLPASFAADWTLPPTSVTGTPDGQLYVLPTSLIGKGSSGSSTPAAKPAAAPATGVPAVPVEGK